MSQIPVHRPLKICLTVRSTYGMQSGDKSILKRVGKSTSLLRNQPSSSFGMLSRFAQRKHSHIFRPRGWHLDELRVTVDNQPMSGSLFDFALYFYHNAHELSKRGFGPYFYLPKMEHYLEARLWNDVFL